MSIFNFSELPFIRLLRYKRELVTLKITEFQIFSSYNVHSAFLNNDHGNDLSLCTEHNALKNLKDIQAMFPFYKQSII